MSSGPRVLASFLQHLVLLSDCQCGQICGGLWCPLHFSVLVVAPRMLLDFQTWAAGKCTQSRPCPDTVGLNIRQHPVLREGELLDRPGPDLEEPSRVVADDRNMQWCTLMVHLLAL